MNNLYPGHSGHSLWIKCNLLVCIDYKVCCFSSVSG